MERLQAPIDSLKGVGVKRATLYRKMGVETLSDLLQLYPRTYEDWSQPMRIADASPFEPACIRVTVLQVLAPQYIRKGMTLYRFKVTDGETMMTVTLFNNIYAAKKIVAGQTLLLYGIVKLQGRSYGMTSPLIDTPENGARIRPIYPQTAGLTSRGIETNMRQLLQEMDEMLDVDWLPDDLRRQYALCTRRFALQNIHFPKDAMALSVARERLIFEELFLYILGMSQLRGRNRARTGCVVTQDETDTFCSMLPFTLTGAQSRAIGDGMRDMMQPHPMARLIQGDVGSGKTVIAAALAFSAAKNGLQTALMVPTEILARQHLQSLQKVLGDSVRIALLTGSMTVKEKRQVLDGLADGSIDIAVGTHALISDAVQFKRLGLVVTDEQHRFGVLQRAALAQKGEHPHLLVMSATPIPRTLALLVYGDLDVSVLDELPPGRQPIATYAVGSALHERVYGFIRKHIAEGRQAYIVCPLVEEGEDSGDLTAATTYYETLKNGALRGIPTALLHGKMRAKEKDAVMQAFAAGEISVLVSTVVIEVGVDVPNAVLMVIENADRFGLAQLHQLRGRVGRGKHASTCILISDAEGENAKQRLDTMCRTSDGFKIAEQDLKMRGPGDFFGSRQHGLPNMRIANLISDMAVLHQAKQAVDSIISRDPALTLPEHQSLSRAVAALFTVGADVTAN